MADFFDRLVAVCAPEIAAAVKTNDADRAAAMIEGLATMLGRTIARAAGGDAREIEKILMGCEQHIAAEAAGVAGLINLQETLRARRGG
ncbi:hypothetical protein LOS78_01630 [Paracoccus sp. MA]|uniref:hypothetical protein n=1 Tax=Paracoccus sp. MA TaxID=2895796 RepID=UPI001E5A06C6|nr:hypothetical protein [Paracoccus sp. MA]UFM64199.1 hypothetical protein LOS78_01630 [Paracoccus sp. MA]